MRISPGKLGGIAILRFDEKYGPTFQEKKVLMHEHPLFLMHHSVEFTSSF